MVTLVLRYNTQPFIYWTPHCMPRRRQSHKRFIPSLIFTRSTPLTSSTTTTSVKPSSELVHRGTKRQFSTEQTPSPTNAQKYTASVACNHSWTSKKPNQSKATSIQIPNPMFLLLVFATLLLISFIILLHRHYSTQ